MKREVQALTSIIEFNKDSLICSRISTVNTAGELNTCLYSRKYLLTGPLHEKLANKIWTQLSISASLFSRAEKTFTDYLMDSSLTLSLSRNDTPPTTPASCFCFPREEKIPSFPSWNRI